MDTTLPDCDPEIFRNGVQVFLTHTLSAIDMERWVKKVATESGQPVDWHCAGGRFRVLTTGDVEQVLAAMTNLMAEHDKCFLKESRCYQTNLPEEEITYPRPKVVR